MSLAQPAAPKRWAVQQPELAGRPGEGLRVAVAGASHWHLERHARYLAEAGVTFVAVSDPNPAVAGRWAQNLGCRAVPDTAAVAAAKPDLVLALGRVSEMAAQARLLLEARIPLLAEKPLGLNAVESAPLAALAEARGVWASVALVQRYDPLWRLLDEARERGDLGDVTHADMRIVNGPPFRYQDWGAGWMLDPHTAGGGALLNLGIHCADFLRHLFDTPLRVAGAAVSRVAHRLPIEDFGTAILLSERGAIGTVEAGYTFPDPASGMTRGGDSETRVGATGLYLIGRGAEVTCVTRGGDEQVLAQVRAGDRYRDWIFDSLARFRRGAPPAASIHDCVEAVRLIDAIYAAAGEPREVSP